MKFLGEYRESAQPKNKQMDITEDIIHYMRENIEKKITLSDLAAQAG